MQSLEPSCAIDSREGAGSTSCARSACFSPCGGSVAVVVDAVRLEVWDLQPIRLRWVRQVDPEYLAMAQVVWHEEGARILTAGLNWVRAFSARDGGRLDLPETWHCTLEETYLSDDGRCFVLCCLCGRLEAWSLDSGESLGAMRVARGGMLFGCCSGDGTLFVGTAAAAVQTPLVARLGSPRTRRRLSGPRAGLTSGARSRCGRFGLTGTEQGALQLWDLRSQCAVWEIMTGLGELKSVAVSPCGRWVAAVSHACGGIIYSTQTQEAASRLLAEGEGLVSVRFSSDGGQVVTAGLSGRTLVWNLGSRW